MKINVLVAYGKTTSNADSVTLHQFDSHDTAETFCLLQTNLKSKFWTKAEIVKDGDVLYCGNPHEIY